MARPLYPYRRLREPTMQVTSSLVVPDTEKQEVDLSHFFDEERREIELQIELELDSRDRDLPEDLQVVATLACKRTNLRQSVPLHSSSIDRRFWSGTVEVSAENCMGPSKLYAIVAGTARGQLQKNLAQSDPWTVFVDDLRDGMPVGGLDVKWVNFSEDDYLRTYRNDPYYLDVGEDSQPVVLLNGEMEELRRILPERNPPRDALAALYELTRTSIAKGVWQSLAAIAISAIEADEDNPDLYQLPYDEWQRQVLKMLLPAALNTGMDDALATAAKARIDPMESRSLVARMALIISHGIIEEGKAIRTSKGILDKYAGTFGSE